MSSLIDIQAALVAPTRVRTPMAWRDLTGSMKRAELFGQQFTAQHPTQGRVADARAYATSNQHFSIRSGPPTSS